MLFSDINFDNIIFRKPVAFESGWFSAVWYKNGRNSEKLIIRPPRLRILYGAKKFDTSYCYCVSLSDYDISDDVNDFLEFLKQCDTTTINYFRANRKEWNIDIGGRMKYNPALSRKNKDQDFYLKIKLLQNKNQEVITTIFSSDRKRLAVEDIIYGKYADQYLEYCGISISEEGIIYPVWYAHQLVISPYERLFVDKLLLDDVSPMLHVAQAVPYVPPVPKVGSGPAQNLPKITAMISADMLQSMKSRLKGVRAKDVSEVNPQEQVNEHLASKQCAK